MSTAAGEPAQDDAHRAGPGETRQRLIRWGEAYAFVGVLVAVIIFFSLLPASSATFPTTANFQVVLGNQAVIALVALGALIPLVCEELDLSVGATAGLSSIYVASAMSTGTPVVLAILLGIGIGILVGLVNAFLITRLHISSVVTTLATATLVAGVITEKTSGIAVVSEIPRSVTNFGSANTLGIPRTALVLLVVAIGVYVMLSHVPVGRYLFARGSNPEAARLAGLRTRFLLGFAFVASGALAGAAGVLQVARAGGADPRVGEGFTLPALAAAFLSAASIQPGKYNVGGTLVAIFLLAALNSGLNLAGAPTYVNSYVNGGALLVGVALAVALGRRRSGESSAV